MPDDADHETPPSIPRRERDQPQGPRAVADEIAGHLRSLSPGRSWEVTPASELPDGVAFEALGTPERIEHYADLAGMPATRTIPRRPLSREVVQEMADFMLDPATESHPPEHMIGDSDAQAAHRGEIERLRAQVQILSESSLAQELQRANRQIERHQREMAAAVDHRQDALRKIGTALGLAIRVQGEDVPSADLAPTPGMIIGEISRLRDNLTLTERSAQTIELGRREAAEAHMAALRELAAVAGMAPHVEVTFDNLHALIVAVVREAKTYREAVADLTPRLANANKRADAAARGVLATDGSTWASDLRAALGAHFAPDYTRNWPGLIECVGDVVRGFAAWSQRAQRAEGHNENLRDEVARLRSQLAATKECRKALIRIAELAGFANGDAPLADLVTVIESWTTERSGAPSFPPDAAREIAQDLGVAGPMSWHAARSAVRAVVGRVDRARASWRDLTERTERAERRIDALEVRLARVESPQIGVSPVYGDVPKDESPAAMLDRLGDDAGAWADDFIRINRGRVVGSPVLDVGLMITWFANAIEHGSDVKRWRREKVERDQAVDAGG